MEYFQVRYDSRVVIYERKMFIRLATGLNSLMFANSVILSILRFVAQNFLTNQSS